MARTQTATVVVTDIVGSTELRVQMGEERTEQLRRLHDRALADVTASNGGTLIKGMGDGVLTTFPGAAEAVQAAVEMQQAVDALAARQQVPLAIRVGISSGDVTFEGGDCFGTPVVEASRLCAAAATSEILAADIVQVLARGRGGHELSAPRSLELKGLPDPVGLVTVGWEPLRHVADLRGVIPYVGRETERKALAATVERLLQGTGQVVLVCGEPGIGKSRLVREATESLARSGAVTLLAGGCHDGDVVPHAPFVEGLGRWVRGLTTEDAVRLLAGAAPSIARLVPAVREVLPDVDEPAPVAPDEVSARLHDAVTETVRRLAAERPVIVVAEDLHWADRGTVDLFRAVARVSLTAPVAVIGTYRETDLDRRHPLADALGVLRREVEPRRIALSGLSVDEVQQLLVEIADHDVPAEFAALLGDRTEGNPFFLRETLLSLVEEDRLRYEDGQWVAEADDLAIPEGVREVIGRRLSRLSDAANQLLAVGALFEAGFSLPVATDVAKLDEDAALDAIDDAIRARVVEATDAFDHYRFTHALFRQTLISEMNPSRQVRLHRAIAEAIEKRTSDTVDLDTAVLLARHYERSSAIPGAERGVAYALQVADSASEHGAPHEALEALYVARELLPDGDDRTLDVAERIAHLSVTTQVPEAELEAAARAFLSLAEQDLGAEAALQRYGALLRAARTIGLTASIPIARIGRHLVDHDRRDALWLDFRMTELMEIAYADPSYSGSMPDDPAWREVAELGDRIPLSGLQWTPPIRTRERGRAILLAPDAHLFVRSMAGFSAGEPETLAAIARELLEQHRRSGVLISQLAALNLLGRAENVLGNFEAADEALRDAAALVPKVDPESNAVFQFAAAHLLSGVVRGRTGNVDALEDTARAGPTQGARWAGLATELCLASAHAHRGDPDRARALLRDALPLVERTIYWDVNMVLILQLAADVAWTLDDPTEAPRIRAKIDDGVLAAGMRYPEADTHVALAYLSAVGREVEEARRWFDGARQVFRDQGTEPLIVGVDFNEALLELRLGPAGDPTRFESLVDDVRARATHPAMHTWLRRVDRLAERAAETW